MWQAFDAPWPMIQANAIYFSSSMLALTDDQHILSLHYTQVILQLCATDYWPGLRLIAVLSENRLITFIRFLAYWLVRWVDLEKQL